MHVTDTGQRWKNRFSEWTTETEISPSLSLWQSTRPQRSLGWFHINLVTYKICFFENPNGQIGLFTCGDRQIARGALNRNCTVTKIIIDLGYYINIWLFL